MLLRQAQDDQKTSVPPRKGIILGVDPGSRVAGYAFIAPKRQPAIIPSHFAVIEAGVLRIDARLPMFERLGLLHEGLFDLIARHSPAALVLEKAFYDKNISTALKLGEVRGALIAAARRFALPVAEITPAEVKKLITGNGRADKEQVSLSLKALMRFDRGNLPHDVTDALAISLCYGLKMTAGWQESALLAKEASPCRAGNVIS